MSWRFNPFTNQLDRVECPPVLIDIDVTDSPYTVIRPAGGKTIINVDNSAGNVVINLYPKQKLDEITIKRKTATANTIEYFGDNSDTIDGLSSRLITGQYNSDFLVGETNEWGRY